MNVINKVFDHSEAKNRLRIQLAKVHGTRVVQYKLNVKCKIYA